MKKAIVSAAALTMLLGACTKEKPLKEVPKGKVGLIQADKSVIDTTADFLYVGSTVQSDRKATSSRPHWMGDAKRVRFVFTEKDLKVVEPEKDGRFAENPVNNRVVLSMPIQHVDYKCAEDDFGKCTHREEESNDIKWNQKRYFVLQSEQLSLQQLNFLPLEIEKFFGSPCTKEVRAEVISAEVTPDAINLILEKTFQDTCPDYANYDEASDLSFSVRYQHSFVKMNKMASASYQPVRYTRADEGNFGYFSTQQLTLDVDNNDVVGSEKYFFDRWNPNRKEIVYYLSSNFNKPEHAAIKQATHESVAAINDGFQKAGADLRIVLKEPIDGMSSGDVRYNMIVMEEDPQAAGVIGYGPHASNPATGEILSAKTIMYLGTMKKYLKYNYDELVREKQAGVASTGPILASNLTLDDRLVARASRQAGTVGASANQGRSAVQQRLARRANRNVIVRPADVAKMQKYALRSKSDQNLVKDAREKMEFMSKHCLFPGEMINLEGKIGEGVDEVLEEVGMKPWKELSESEKAKVVAVLLPHVWKPTLIHELGHNLGLRHNFAGSEDKENFYSEQELAAMGIQRPAAYSSVMDYGYRTNNELRVMGKYDIAALRYAYAEKVELKDGSIISLQQLRANPSAELKAYSYCTDEHVAANPNCNRFDEGTNLREIAQHYVRAYHERYARANFRNDRRKFSLLGDSAQIGAIDNTMYELRLAFERYESIKNRFDLADDAPEWQSIPFLQELKDATLIAGQFFIDVIKTPDLQCAVSETANPNRILALLPIRELSKEAISCFDKENIRLNPQFMVVAEAGKSYQSRKDPSSDNPWADQIDVRGIWMDKSLANYYLFKRELGSTLTDQYTENFLHVPELQSPILTMIQEVLTDELVGAVNFRVEGGGTADLEIPYKLFDLNDANHSHKLPAVMDPIARFTLGLKDETTMYHERFIADFRRHMGNDSHVALTQTVYHLMRARHQLPNDGRPGDYVMVETLPGSRVFVRNDSPIALGIADNLNQVRILGQLTPEQQAKVLAAIEAGSEVGLTDVEKEAFKLGKDSIEKLQQGGFQQPGFYALILDYLAI